MRSSRGSGARFVGMLVVLAGLSIWLAAGASAKFGLRLWVSTSQPRVGQAVSARILTGPLGGGACRMRLLAVAPGVGRQRALDAFIGGGYVVMGPTGPSFHRVRASRRLGFLARMRRTGPTRWRATLEFPRAGRWQLVVPNWCAPGYATPPPAIRLVTVH
jgi:hypothetical protein